MPETRVTDAPACARVPRHTCEGWDYFIESVLLFHLYMHSGDQTQLYPLSFLTSLGFSQTRSHSMVQAGLKLTVILFSLVLDYRHKLPCPANLFI